VISASASLRDLTARVATPGRLLVVVVVVVRPHQIRRRAERGVRSQAPVSVGPRRERPPRERRALPEDGQVRGGSGAVGGRRGGRIRRWRVVRDHLDDERFLRHLRMSVQVQDAPRVPVRPPRGEERPRGRVERVLKKAPRASARACLAAQTFARVAVCAETEGPPEHQSAGSRSFSRRRASHRSDARETNGFFFFLMSAQTDNTTLVTGTWVRSPAPPSARPGTHRTCTPLRTNRPLFCASALATAPGTRGTAPPGWIL